MFRTQIGQLQNISPMCHLPGVHIYQPYQCHLCTNKQRQLIGLLLTMWTVSSWQITCVNHVEAALTEPTQFTLAHHFNSNDPINGICFCRLREKTLIWHVLINEHISSFCADFSCFQLWDVPSYVRSSKTKTLDSNQVLIPLYWLWNKWVQRLWWVLKFCNQNQTFLREYKPFFLNMGKIIIQPKASWGLAIAIVRVIA